MSPARREHIARVVELLERWARALRLPDEEAAAWRDAGRWHDALRDADPEALRREVPDCDLPPKALHGPAAAARLAREGEARASVLDAVRWHTVGHAAWDRTGQALYMADYLEPGRRFARDERAALARRVPAHFDDTFREVVRHRLLWVVKEGKALHPQTAAMWNAIR